MEELVGEFKIFFSYLRDISHNWRKQQSWKLNLLRFNLNKINIVSFQYENLGRVLVQYTGPLFTAVIKIKSTKTVWIWPNAWKNYQFCSSKQKTANTWQEMHTLQIFPMTRRTFYGILQLVTILVSLYSVLEDYSISSHQSVKRT
jgi:hypothetical protein